MAQREEKASTAPKPAWLRLKLPSGPVYEQVRSMLANVGIHTVCQEAHCPNQWECFSSRTAAFLIMGPHCTRNCGFCAVDHGPPGPPDPEEPTKVAEAAKSLGLLYAVVTSVTRDDLSDGGASCFAATIRALREKMPATLVEVLIPDFQGELQPLLTVLAAGPDVINHNIETVERLYGSVRLGASYERSLGLLGAAKRAAPRVPVKSGLMLGLGETAEEIRRTMKDILDAGCTMLTLGQYLQPSALHLPVTRYVPPEEFDDWKEVALEAGFSQVASGPFVRSSYHAENLFKDRPGS
ncbi:MAG: lipoyl synthase [Syntrophobacteraceae bacterium]|nr:lipoyl synthase [Syntrophobacteraceae bacterium]